MPVDNNGLREESGHTGDPGAKSASGQGPGPDNDPGIKPASGQSPGLDNAPGVKPASGHSPKQDIDLGPKSAGYVRTLRRWAPFLLREPNALLSGSVFFVLASLPLITLGPAWAALHYYMAARESGVQRTWRGACRFAFRECGAKAWLMGLTDALALLMAGGCWIAVFGASGAPGAEVSFLPLPLRFIYAALFAFDIIYLISGMYRYPALCAEPANSAPRLAARGFLLAFGNVGWTLMFFFSALLAFIACALTGVGILALFPAASAALSCCAYDEMTAYYI